MYHDPHFAPPFFNVDFLCSHLPVRYGDSFLSPLLFNLWNTVHFLNLRYMVIHISALPAFNVDFLCPHLRVCGDVSLLSPCLCTLWSPVYFLLLNIHGDPHTRSTSLHVDFLCSHHFVCCDGDKFPSPPLCIPYGMLFALSISVQMGGCPLSLYECFNILSTIKNVCGGVYILSLSALDMAFVSITYTS